jgi:hypothetical protein
MGALVILVVCGIAMVGTYALGLGLTKGITREEIGLLPLGKRLLKLFPEKGGPTPPSES